MVSAPTAGDPVFRYKLQRYNLKRVGYEEEVEPRIQMTTAGWIVAGSAWALALGGGTYLLAEGTRNGKSDLKSWGSVALFASDAVLAGTLAFRLFGHGRKLKPRWVYIDHSDRNVVDSVSAATLAPVEVRLKAPSGEQAFPLSTDLEGVVEIPIRDLEPYLSAGKPTPAKLVYPHDDKTYTNFAVGTDVASGPALTLLKPNEEFVQVDDEVIEISALANDPVGLRHLVVLVNGKKQLDYEPKAAQREYAFNAAVKLNPGLNVLRVRAQGRTGSIERIVHVERSTSPPQVYAVFVGISQYASLPPVGFAAEDARALHELTTRKGLVGSANAFLLVNEDATLERVRELLGTELKQRATPNDDVVVYFAGHGATEKDPAAPDGDGFAKYIALHDTRPGSLYSTALPMEEIRTLFERIRARNVLFLLDTCYSGGGGRTISKSVGKLSDGFLNRLAEAKGRAVMSSAGPLEVAREDPKLKHGIYTFTLLEALDGKADLNDDRVLTVEELHTWISGRVRELTDGKQTPTLRGTLDLTLRLEP